MRQAEIYNHNILAGILTEDETGYTFQYDANYLQSDNAEAISLTMPLVEKPFCFHSSMDSFRRDGFWILPKRVGKSIVEIECHCFLLVAKIASAQLVLYPF